jgi:hypothetical protein
MSSRSNNANDEIIQRGRRWILPSHHNDYHVKLYVNDYYDVKFVNGHGVGE